MRHLLRTQILVAIAGATAPLDAEIRYLLDDPADPKPVVSIIATNVITDGKTVPAPWLEAIVLGNPSAHAELIEHARVSAAAKAA